LELYLNNTYHQTDFGFLSKIQGNSQLYYKKRIIFFPDEYQPF